MTFIGRRSLFLNGAPKYLRPTLLLLSLQFATVSLLWYFFFEEKVLIFFRLKNISNNQMTLKTKLFFFFSFSFEN